MYGIGWSTQPQDRTSVLSSSFLPQAHRRLIGLLVHGGETPIWTSSKRDVAWESARLLGIWRGFGELILGMRLREQPIPVGKECSIGIGRHSWVLRHESDASCLGCLAHSGQGCDAFQACVLLLWGVRNSPAYWQRSWGAAPAWRRYQFHQWSSSHDPGSCGIRCCGLIASLTGRTKSCASSTS